MAHNPAVLSGVLGLWQGRAQRGLSSQDREVVCLQMAMLNGCHYCVPARRYTTAQQGLDAALIECITAGKTLEGDSRPAMFQKREKILASKKDKFSDTEFEIFVDSGMTSPDLVEIIREIECCTFANYFNRLTTTKLDPFLMPHHGG